jgi:hypothetical protein
MNVGDRSDLQVTQAFLEEWDLHQVWGQLLEEWEHLMLHNNLDSLLDLDSSHLLDLVNLLLGSDNLNNHKVLDSLEQEQERVQEECQDHLNSQDLNQLKYRVDLELLQEDFKVPSQGLLSLNNPWGFLI